MKFRILHYQTLDSTNNLALFFAREGVREGTVIVSDYQTHGRGRFARQWISPRGKGLLFSIVLRPNFKTSAAPILTHLAAQSVAEALKAVFNLSATLKKLNDVLIGGKKIAGILTESCGSHNHLEYVVVGVGLNVNSKRQELGQNATSVYLEISEKAKLDLIFQHILSIFSAKYSELKDKNTNEQPGKKEAISY